MIDGLHQETTLAGRQISTMIIQVIWKYVLDTWTIQNQHLHNDNGHLSQPNYHLAVQIMYKTRQQLPEETQEALFSHPIKQLLEQSPEFLCKWILRSNKYIKQQL